MHRAPLHCHQEDGQGPAPPQLTSSLGTATHAPLRPCGCLRWGRRPEAEAVPGPLMARRHSAPFPETRGPHTHPTKEVPSLRLRPTPRARSRGSFSPAGGRSPLPPRKSELRPGTPATKVAQVNGKAWGDPRFPAVPPPAPGCGAPLCGPDREPEPSRRPRAPIYEARNREQTRGARELGCLRNLFESLPPIIPDHLLSKSPDPGPRVGGGAGALRKKA